jgi:hypothetical protein
MKHFRRTLSAAAVIAMCVTVASTVRGDDDNDPAKALNRYVVTNLTSDLPGIAPNTDPVLQNAWGVAFTPGASPFWDASAPAHALAGEAPAARRQCARHGLQTCRPEQSAEPDACGADRPRVESHRDISRAAHDPPGHIHLEHRGRNDFSVDGRVDPA